MTKRAKVGDKVRDEDGYVGIVDKVEFEGGEYIFRLKYADGTTWWTSEKLATNATEEEYLRYCLES